MTSEAREAQEASPLSLGTFTVGALAAIYKESDQLRLLCWEEALAMWGGHMLVL